MNRTRSQSADSVPTTVPALRGKLKELGLPTSGNKAKLVQRLRAHIQDVETSVESDELTNVQAILRATGQNSAVASSGGSPPNRRQVENGGSGAAGGLDEQLLEAEKRIRLLKLRKEEAQLESEFAQLRVGRSEARDVPGRQTAPDHLSHRARELLGSSYAARSKSAISSHVRSWRAYCSAKGLDPAGCTVSTLLNYLAGLAGRRLRAYSSVRGHVSSLSLWFRLNGAQDLTKHNYERKE